MLLRTKSDHVVAELPAPAWVADLSWRHHRLLSHTATGFIWVFTVYLDPLLFYFNLLEEIKALTVLETRHQLFRRFTPDETLAAYPVDGHSPRDRQQLFGTVYT